MTLGIIPPFLGLSQNLVTGKIVSHTGTVLSGVSATLTHHDTLGVDQNQSTDSTGRFYFKGISAGTYRITLSMVGYKMVKNLSVTVATGEEKVDIGTVVLEDSLKQLQDVVVTSAKNSVPYVQRQPDKIVINPAQRISSEGASAWELIQQLPGVQASTDGSVVLSGKPGTQVLIDGKPTYAAGTDLVTLLTGLNAAEVASIEIMSNPSAKYDASGSAGIVNIIRMKNRKDGLNGNLTFAMGLAEYGRYSAGVSFNYKNKWYNLFLTQNYAQAKTLFGRNMTSEISNNGHLSTQQVSGNRDINYNRNFRTAAGIDLFLSAKSTLTFTGEVNNRKSTTATRSSLDLYDSLGSKTGYQSFQADNSDLPVNFASGAQWQLKLDTAGQQLSVQADYASFNYYPGQNNTTLLFDPSGGMIQSSSVFLDQFRKLRILGCYADYSKPLHNGKLEAGFKLSHVNTDNSSIYYDPGAVSPVADLSKSAYYINQENIHAAYVNLHTRMNKWYFEPGLRLEQTLMSGTEAYSHTAFRQNYLQLFPTIFIERKLDEKHTLNLQVGRRIERADYHELTPFRRPLTPTLYFQGNPNLRPEISWHGELTWSYRNELSVTVGYTTYHDYVRTIPFLDSNHFTMTRIPSNIPHAEAWNLDLSYNKRLSKLWSMNNSVSVYENLFSGDLGGFEVSGKGMVSVYIESNHSFAFGKGLTAEVGAEYDSPRQLISSVFGSYYLVNVGIKQQMLHKKASLSLTVHNLLQSEGRNGSDQYENLLQHYYADFHTRLFNLAFSYRFGKGKIRQSQQDSGSSEEKKRAGS